MKYVLSFLMTMSFFLIAHAQQGVGIGTSNPHTTSVLELFSTSKGLLIPRMTASQRLAIGLPGTPATGLMVYETTSNSFWGYNGSAWVQLASGGSSPWAISGINIYNTNSGNVGIGTNAPESKFHLAGDMLINNANPVIQFQSAGLDKGYVQLSGNNLRMGTNSGNNLGKMIVRMDGSDKIFIDSTGNMQIIGEQDVSLSDHGYLTLGNTGTTNLVLDNNEIMARNNGAAANLTIQNDGGNVSIGHSSPQDRLDVDGSARLTGGNRVLKIETSVAGPSGQFIINKYAPGMHFIRQDGTLLGKMEYVDTLSYSNFLRFQTGSTISNDFVIGTDHNIGIGTTDAVAKLQINSGGSEQLRIYAPTGGFVQFTSGLAASQLKKAFIDVSGNDFRLGTNTENNLGNLNLRVNGVNTLNITPDNNVGIGTETPSAKLHVAGLSRLSNGTADALAVTGRSTIYRSGEALKIDGSNPYIQMYHNGAPKSFMFQEGDNFKMGISTGNTGNFIIDAPHIAIGPLVQAAADGGYKLAVNGKVICEELKVELKGSWPDYVFGEHYGLMPLGELRNFIKMNNHLPNIPSALEMQKNGLEVGDMQKRLMEKVEELTLYILQLEEKINKLSKETQL